MPLSSADSRSVADPRNGAQGIITTGGQIPLASDRILQGPPENARRRSASWDSAADFQELAGFDRLRLLRPRGIERHPVRTIVASEPPHARRDGQLGIDALCARSGNERRRDTGGLHLEDVQWI